MTASIARSISMICAISRGGAAAHDVRLCRWGRRRRGDLAQKSQWIGAYALVGRALQGVPVRDLSVTVLDEQIAMPVLVAPTGSSGLLWPRGEAEVARACAKVGTIMSVSAGSTLSIEEITDAAPGPKWLQLFIYRDRAITEEFATSRGGRRLHGALSDRRLSTAWAARTRPAQRLQHQSAIWDSRLRSISSRIRRGGSAC